MAILKFGTLITAARGTIGGVTFSANAAGPYAKPWAAPPKSTTARQAVQRAAFAAFRNPWRALSPSERADWNTFAADPAQEQLNVLGESYYLSGWQWFCRVNGWRVQTYPVNPMTDPVIDPAIITAPPSGGPANAPVLTAFEAHYDPPPSASIEYDPPSIAAGEYILVDMTVLYTTSQLYAPPSTLAVYAFDHAYPATLTFSDSLIAAFGGLSPGTQLLARVYLLPIDGYRSPAAQIACAVEA
jgi:hypothetical protein